jgi:hypothetical protein
MTAQKSERTKTPDLHDKPDSNGPRPGAIRPAEVPTSDVQEIPAPDPIGTPVDEPDVRNKPGAYVEDNPDPSKGDRNKV